jgi:hypothetical protein
MHLHFILTRTISRDVVQDGIDFTIIFIFWLKVLFSKNITD